MKRTAFIFDFVIAIVAVLLAGQSGHAHADELTSDAWMTTKSDCRIFTPNSLANSLEKTARKAVAWTGHCKNSYAEGDGVVTWFGSGKTWWLITGTMSMGKMQGRVVMKSGNGITRYDGEARNSIANGTGTFYYDDGRYEGGWVTGVRSGQGRLYRNDGSLSYEGGWKNDQWNGYGSTYYENSNRHEVGNWVNGVHQDGTVLYHSYGTLWAVLNDGKFVDYVAENQYSQPTGSVNPDGDNSVNSNTHAGLQIVGAALSATIQTRGVKDAAASQRAYQAAANKLARANAAALTQASLAAAHAEQAAAQARQQTQAQQAASAKPHSQNATQCVRQDRNQLINTCSETITVVYCVVGDYSNCNRGLDMEDSIKPGVDWRLAAQDAECPDHRALCRMHRLDDSSCARHAGQMRLIS